MNTVDLLFQAISWHDFDYEDDDGDKRYKCRIFGRTLDSKTVYLEVDNFTPYFFVEIPKKWRINQINIFISTIKSLVDEDFKQSLVSYNVVDKHKFYGFTNNELFTFIRLLFDSIEAFYKFRNVFYRRIHNSLLSRYPKKYEAFETNIPPLLRLIHHRELDPSGWILIKGQKYKILNENKTINDINIFTKWTHLKYYKSEQIAKLKILSFDLECTSIDGGFPQPERPGDKIIQIGNTFHKFGETECYYRHIITLGSCDKVEGSVVESYDKEEDVIMAWKRLLDKTNPDIITGYNIFGFDYRYLYGRSKLLGINREFSKLSRLVNYECKFIEQDLASSALGQNKFYYYVMPGRINIDLMKVVQRDYRLDSYTLNFVSSTFIRESILSIEIKKSPITDSEEELFNGTTIINTNNTYGLKKSQFIIIYYNDGLSDNKFMKGKKFKIKDLTNNKIELYSLIDSNLFNDKKLKFFWCQAKDDVTAQEIFKLQEEGSKERAKIAKYCIQDCELCNKLIIKLQIIPNNIGMSNVCTVPLSFIFLRGQGIKLFSLVAKVCKKKNFVIPVIRKKKKNEKDPQDDDDDGYEGAYVFQPDKGVYYVPITVLDYASLYPRSMIHKNLSHEMLVTDNKRYGEVPGYKYHQVEYKNKNGETTVCRFAQKKDGSPGIIPEILNDLLDARSATKKKMKKESDPFKKSIYDGLQSAYKITANSLYGQIGAPTSAIFLKSIAASTTAIGRKMLVLAKDYMENDYPEILNNLCINLNKKKEFNKILKKEYKEYTDYLKDKKKGITSEVDSNNIKTKIKKMKILLKSIFSKYSIEPKTVYGDSVTSDTPLLLKNKKTGFIEFKQIDNLSNDKWKSYEGFKAMETNRREKQQNIVEDYQIYTSAGWSNINRVIRHKTIKKIYRVTTHTGMVDVTEDHSLLDKNGKIVKPTEIKVGMKLLHKYPQFENKEIKLKDILNYIKNIGEVSLCEKKAFIFGFFYGDGSCGKYNCPSGVKYSWALNQKNIKMCTILQSLLIEIYNEPFKINDTVKSSGVYKIVPNCGNIKKYVEMYIPICYNKDKYKIIPVDILNDKYNIRYAYFAGYYAADGSKCPGEKAKTIRMSNKGKIGSAMLYYLVSSIGFNVSINTRKDKLNITRLTCTSGKQRKQDNVIKKVDLIGENVNDFVYDIETETGNFNTGYPLIVKNTDSVFINFDIRDKEGNIMDDKEALSNAIKLGILGGDFIKSRLPYPHDLEYEKTFWPFIIITKKRYVGNLYEFDINEYKQKSMGIVLKRRDNPDIVKILVGGIVKKILNERSTENAIKFTHDVLRDMLDNKYPLYKFITTKTLKSRYENRSQIAHAVLADRMTERDAGSAPATNDRIAYGAVLIDKNKIIKEKTRKRKKAYKIFIKEMNSDDNQELLDTIINKIYEFIMYNINGIPFNMDDAKKFMVSEFKKEYWDLLESKLDKEKEDIKKVKRFCKKIFKYYIGKINDKISINIDDGMTGKFSREVVEEYFKYAEGNQINNLDKFKVLKNKFLQLLDKRGMEECSIIQGDIIETEDYILKNNLQLDYLYYIRNQMMKPTLQFLELLINNAKKIFEKYINEEENKRKNKLDINSYMEIDSDNVESNKNNVLNQNQLLFNDNKIIVKKNENKKKKINKKKKKKDNITDCKFKDGGIVLDF
jgi:DNA polymerase elongation subunit (family B)